MARTSSRGSRPEAELQGLPDSHWKQYRNVRLLGCVPTQLIDHLLVGPSGVYVITTVGTASVTDVEGSAQAGLAVGSVLQRRYRSRVRPVCVETVMSSVERIGGVIVTSYPILEHVVRSSPVVLSTSEVKDVVARLEGRLEQLPGAPRARLRMWTWRRLVTASAVAAGVALGWVAVGSEGLGLLTGR